MDLRKEAAAGASPHVALADGDDIMSAQSVPYCRWVGCKKKLQTLPQKVQVKNMIFTQRSRDTKSSIFHAVSCGFARVSSEKPKTEGWQKANEVGSNATLTNGNSLRGQKPKSKTNKQTDINFIDIMNKIAACRKCLIWRHWNGSGAHSTVEIWHCSRKNNGFMFSFALLPLLFVLRFFLFFYLFSVTDSDSAATAPTAGWHFICLTFGTLKSQTKMQFHNSVGASKNPSHVA